MSRDHGLERCMFKSASMVPWSKHYKHMHVPLLPSWSPFHLGPLVSSTALMPPVLTTAAVSAPASAPHLTGTVNGLPSATSSHLLQCYTHTGQRWPPILATSPVSALSLCIPRAPYEAVTGVPLSVAAAWASWIFQGTAGVVVHEQRHRWPLLCEMK